MNYDLAKKLKDAGFPQVAVLGTYFLTGREEEIYIDANLEGGTWNEAGWVRCPTLRELIATCMSFPEGFISLTAPSIKCEGDEFGVTCGWVAVGYKQVGDSGSEKIEIIAISPEEAVANLWMALNKT